MNASDLRLKKAVETRIAARLRRQDRDRLVHTVETQSDAAKLARIEWLNQKLWEFDVIQQGRWLQLRDTIAMRDRDEGLK